MFNLYNISNMFDNDNRKYIDSKYSKYSNNNNIYEQMYIYIMKSIQINNIDEDDNIGMLSIQNNNEYNMNTINKQKEITLIFSKNKSNTLDMIYNDILKNLCKFL